MLNNKLRKRSKKLCNMFYIRRNGMYDYSSVKGDYDNKISTLRRFVLFVNPIAICR